MIESTALNGFFLGLFGMFDCCDLLGLISFLVFFWVDLELGFLGLRKLVSLKPEEGREDERPREEAKFAISE